ncbi:MAG TPA: alpha/beta fold hydrolase [Gaiellaceae bacterium]|nr:alpha/beta fold hydrolase [Gaiellaceae bacterium]
MQAVLPARESYVPVGGARLFARELGQGPPIVVLHGGPELDHRYLLPELDRLAGSFRLVYYDQRGRGRSADGVSPEDVTLDSELADLESIRRHFGLARVAVLGHSWGGLLAMEYAVRHPDRVSHLVLLNTVPASHAGFLRLRAELRERRAPGEVEAMEAIAAGDRYRRGDLDAEAEYLRLHFRTALREPRHLEAILGRLRESFTPETVLKARAIDHRLGEETWESEHFDLHPALRELDVPTLVLHGEDDFIPVELAAHVADSIPHALLTVLPECGHFSYLERPEAVQRSVAALFARS